MTKQAMNIASKLMFSKLSGKVIFSEREFEEMFWKSLEEQKSTRYIREKNIFWYYYLQLFFVYKTVS